MFVRLRNAVSVCKWPNSTSTGVVATATADLVISEGCKLPPVMEASKNSTATPLGGVSPIVKLIGTPLAVGGVFIEPPQAARKAQLTSMSATRVVLHIVDPPAIEPVFTNILRWGLEDRAGRYVGYILTGKGCKARQATERQRSRKLLARGDLKCGPLSGLKRHGMNAMQGKFKSSARHLGAGRLAVRNIRGQLANDKFLKEVDGGGFADSDQRVFKR